MPLPRNCDTADADLQLLAGLAREQAAQQRSAAGSSELPAKGTAACFVEHTPPPSAPSEQPLTLTLHMAQPKTVSAVRLHYRPTDPAAATQAMELAAKPEVSFTIPGQRDHRQLGHAIFFRNSQRGRQRLV